MLLTNQLPDWVASVWCLDWKRQRWANTHMHARRLECCACVRSCIASSFWPGRLADSRENGIAGPLMMRKNTDRYPAHSTTNQIPTRPPPGAAAARIHTPAAENRAAPEQMHAHAYSMTDCGAWVSGCVWLVYAKGVHVCIWRKNASVLWLDSQLSLGSVR